MPKVFRLSTEPISLDDFVKVYRFENAIGEGPYIGSPVTSLSYHTLTTGHPPPSYERLRNENEKTIETDSFNLQNAFETKFGVQSFLCAFKSMEQLHNWFSFGEIYLMEDLGYNLTAYLIPKTHIMYGGKQVLIHKEYKIKCAL